MNHLKSQHPEYDNHSQAPVSTFFQPGPSFTRTGLNLYGWIDWICVDLLPFSFVEKELTRKYSKLTSISRNTLLKYMEKLTKQVEINIAKELPEKFSLIIDGWTCSSTHFVGLFASYSSVQGYSTAMLAFSPLANETSFTAHDHLDFIEYVLGVYGKSVINLIAITGDNAEVNRCLANLLNIPLIGCHSHKFNLAVSKYLDRKSEILEKIAVLMGKLRFPKMAGELRQLTNLKPVLRNKTRWLSTMNMIDRYFEMKGFVENLPSFSKLVDYFPSARENSELKELQETLPKLISVTKALQRENIDMSDARILFDGILDEYKEEEFAKYLSEDGDLVHVPVFQKAIIKLLKHKEADLTIEEKAAVESLKLPVVEVTHAVNVDEDDFASGLLKNRKLEKKNSRSEYMDPTFLLPTSDLIERFLA